MVAAADAQNYAQKLGITHGMVVQELGWDEDTDDDLRADVEDTIGGELVDEDSDEVVDVVLLWWRDGDGDLVDALMDAIGPLADDGFVWVLTPEDRAARPRRAQRDRRVRTTAGLTQTSAVNLGAWTGSRLVQPQARRVPKQR